MSDEVDFRPFSEKMAQMIYERLVKNMRLASSRAEWNVQPQRIRDYYKDLSDFTEEEWEKEFIRRGWRRPDQSEVS